MIDYIKSSYPQLVNAFIRKFSDPPAESHIGQDHVYNGYGKNLLEKRINMKSDSPKLIQSVTRVVDILNCFELHHPRLTLNEISSQTGIHINTVRGLIHTLIAKGLIIHDKSNNTYHLGYYFMGRARIIQSEIDTYINLCKAPVDALANTYHITASVQMVQKDQILTVYCAYPRHTAYYIILSDYTPLPKHATSSGLLLLAYTNQFHEENHSDLLPFTTFTPNTIRTAAALKDRLAIVRQMGYAQENEEFALDVGSLAVPIFEPSEGQLIMTISCTFFVKQLDTIKSAILQDMQNITQSVMTQLQSNP